MHQFNKIIKNNNLKIKEMWFLNDITIKEKGYSESEIIKLCEKINIKIGNAWCNNKWLGRIISDDDYPILLNALANER